MTEPTPTSDAGQQPDADQAADAQPQPPAADSPDAGQPDQGDRGKGNHEAARYRRQLREAESERDQLRERVDRYRRADAERAAADVLSAPADLWIFYEPADVLDDNGEVDPAKVRDLAQTVAVHRPGLAKPKPPNSFTFGQGRRDAVHLGDGGWSGVLRGH